MSSYYESNDLKKFGDIGRHEIRMRSVEVALEMIIELAKLG